MHDQATERRRYERSIFSESAGKGRTSAENAFPVDRSLTAHHTPQKLLIHTNTIKTQKFYFGWEYKKSEIGLALVLILSVCAILISQTVQKFKGINHYFAVLASLSLQQNHRYQSTFRKAKQTKNSFSKQLQRDTIKLALLWINREVGHCSTSHPGIRTSKGIAHLDDETVVDCRRPADCVNACLAINEFQTLNRLTNLLEFAEDDQ